MNDLKTMIKLTDNELNDFKNLIKQNREIHISPPSDTVRAITIKHKNHIDELIRKMAISQVIIELRELAYEQFLLEESQFNGIILGAIGVQFNTPSTNLATISKELYLLKNEQYEVVAERVSRLFGDFAGSISPYIYELCLSNTQSRRSRAGKTFERIIYFLYEYFDFRYESQSSIGKKIFSSLHLGKVVDSILPSTQAFTEYRNKTIIGSMKTTLRERWQEVVEEISRSNLPNIHLLTVDNNIPEAKAKQMAEHNIILVVTNSVKQTSPLKDKRNIIDFETYFTEEIPNIMNYWNK